eukprot:TRINITY_DN1378_c0_g1_i5.p1 TRINITY_DN1378_c0_g1~~TRINITY_DN1378_c0_g1_i5.p1  ORF type:complete len:214 (+),score=39.24 TRINITY_DN1378_c0_g1_i5:103-744(+)
MEEYSIRESTIQDTEEVAMLLASSFTADDFPVKSYWSMDHALEMARKDFSSCLPDGLCFVAVGNTSGKIIGVINIFDSTTPHLSKEDVKELSSCAILHAFTSELYQLVPKFEKGKCAVYSCGAVLPEYRNSKVISKISQASVEKAKKCGYVHLATLDLNHYAYLAAHKAGFKLIKEVEYCSWVYSDENGKSFKPFEEVKHPHTHARLMSNYSF